AGFFKGTSAEQDRRFADKEQKLLKSTKFPAHFDKKVDMRKVNLNVIKPWIAKKIVELVGFEDDILIGYALELLDEPAPDPKKMQLLLQAFLAKDAPIFMGALWTLLLEAQTEVTGVPRTFVEEKKEELRKAREGDTRAFDERDRRARLDELQDGGRGGGRGRGGRGGGRGRGGRGFDDDRGGFGGDRRGRGRERDSGWGSRGGGSGG
ncbi:PWI domain-containing protein, partial [Mycena metata]